MIIRRIPRQLLDYTKEGEPVSQKLSVGKNGTFEMSQCKLCLASLISSQTSQLIYMVHVELLF